MNSSRPETVTAFAPKDVSTTERILGALVLSSFVVMWISSILSPTILVLCLWSGHFALAATIVLISIVSYIPSWNNKSWLSTVLHRNVYYYFPRYFKSMVLEFEGRTLPDTSSGAKQTFYAVHPHGAFSFGWASLFCNPQLRHVRFCFSPILYASPFFRAFSRATGNPGSASKADMVSYMNDGMDVALPPGGFEEATLSSHRHDRVYIKKRMGFVKLCLQRGIAIRPVYVFGEKGLYRNVQGAWKFRIGILNRYGLPAILPWGFPIFPLLPRGNVDVRIVVGAPIELPKIVDPSKEAVQLWHRRYVAALIKLFEDHKEAAYGADAAKTLKLEVW